MRKILAVCAGAVVAAVLTHGIASTGRNLSNEHLPIWTYHGFFTQAILGLWRLWAVAHGWGTIGLREAPAGGIDGFGRALAHMVHLIFPLAGFGVFAVAAREKIGRHWWQPLALITGLALWEILAPAEAPARLIDTLAPYWIRYSPDGIPCLEAAVVLLVMLLMIWSVGARPKSQKTLDL